MTRIPAIDHLRTLGIFLVVFGHTHFFGEINQLIFAFHMPLFFLLSGFLSRPFKPNDKIELCIMKYLKKYTPPYFFYALIGYLFWVFSATFLGEGSVKSAALYEPLLGTLYGTGTPDEIRVKPVVLWFLPCLLVSQIILHALVCYCRKFYLLVSALIATLGFFIPTGIALPLEFETALVTQFFVVVGYHCNTLRPTPELKRWIHPAAGILLMLTGGTLVYLSQNHVDVRSSQFGNPVIFIIAALLLSLGCALLVSRLPAIQLSRFISQNTLIIFSLHLIVLSCLNLLSSTFFPSNPPLLENAVFAFFASVAICIGLAWLGQPVRYLFPWSFGIATPRPTE